MPAPTPEQLRELADEGDKFDFPGHACTFIQQQAATLRAAADQLEAVRSWLDGQDSDQWDSVDLDALDAILTAGPAPGA